MNRLLCPSMMCANYGLLRQGMPVDGILASSDRSAFGAMAALRALGFYVPEDVRLICFDNSPYATLTTPALTTLDRNTGQLARTACEYLTRMIAGDRAIPAETTVPVSLVCRDSTR